jgi:uncharacterized protein YjbI with pentapeptide repeats
LREKDMRNFKGFVPLGLIIVSIFIGASYWFDQQHQLEDFAKQIKSLKVNQNSSIDSKDHIAISRDLITLKNTLNSSLFQLVSGLFFFLTAYTAWWNLEISDKKQIAERFSKAVDQLGNDKLGVRVGGIFALEKIAETYPDEHWIVMEVLMSYIKDQSLQGKSVFKPQVQEEENQTEEENIDTVTNDIQAALIVICRRNIRHDLQGKVIDLSFCDIRRADLKNAKLSNADLTGANISGANLDEADMSGAKLQGTNLSDAILKSANLRKASLKNALLNRACLEKSDLRYADLTHTQFEKANLQDAKLNNSILYLACFMNANLQNADLSQAKFRRTNLKDAVIDNTTTIDKKWKFIHEISTNGSYDKVLSGYDFSEAVLTGANFEGLTLKNIKFNGADLGEANFKNSDIENSSFDKTGQNTSRSNLDKADFSGATLKKVSFKEASLNQTNFEGIRKSTTLSEVIFERSNLKNAIFREAILTKAQFIRSIVQDVDFYQANLCEAKFDNCAYIGSTSFEKAKQDKTISVGSLGNFEKAKLDKTVFVGSLGNTDFRSSNYKQADFKDADTSLALF